MTQPEPIVNRWELAITAEAEVIRAEDIAKQNAEAERPEDDE